MSKYYSSSHSQYLIKLHFIFVIKYRKKILVDHVEQNIKRLIINICSKNEYIVDVFETDKDHIHLLLDVKPIHSAFEVARKLKSMTTFHIWKMNQLILSKHFWKEKTFWTDGYFVYSTGAASTETIKKYIKNQGK